MGTQAMEAQEVQGTQQEQTTEQPVIAVDSEAAELQAAREQLQAAAQESVQDTVSEIPEVAEVQPSAEPAAKHDEHGKGNPTAAIIAMRKRLQDAATENLLLKGQVQALSTMVRGDLAVEPTAEIAEVEEPHDPLKAIKAEKLDLARMFEEGDLTIREMEERRQALEDREWEVRMAAMKPAPQADLQLEAATSQLETDYPVLKILTADDLTPLAEIARRQAERDGVVLQGSTGTLELRTRIAKLATQMYGGEVQQQSSGPTTRAVLSDNAQARESKLALQSRMPPDVTRMGSAATDAAPSESELVSRMSGMTEDEQMALLKSMPGLKTRILGG